AVTPVVRLAPAKLNLTLAVVGRRPDGYHTLHSVMAPLDLADRLTLAVDPSPTADDSLHVEGFETGPAADNLALRAVDATPRPARSPAPPPRRRRVSRSASTSGFPSRRGSRAAAAMPRPRSTGRWRHGTRPKGSRRRSAPPSQQASAATCHSSWPADPRSWR